MAVAKNFFVKDKTGRGYKANLTATHIRSTWDLKETDWNGKSLREYLSEAEVGDDWQDEATLITRTK